ncbi:hypothetical protein [Chitinimonas sp.]|uniref:hypothetical protein n=1 Tax=Chitinimonas sp. TaxID=1934313 RepID=UPI0035B0EC62
MDGLKQNMVLQIEVEQFSGLYRVVALPAGDDIVFLGHIGPSSSDCVGRPTAPVGSVTGVHRSVLKEWSASGCARSVNISAPAKIMQSSDRLNERERKRFEHRQQVMKPFLDHAALCHALSDPKGLGNLVRPVAAEFKCSRSTVYRLWVLLCIHGFEAGSLHPRFDRCGAPGIMRPHQEGRKKVGRKTVKQRLGDEDPGSGFVITSEMRQRIVCAARVWMAPGRSLAKVYDRIIEQCFVTHYVDMDGERKPVLPEANNCASIWQVRHIIRTEISKLERRRRSTTVGHFDRNMRALHGKSFDGVAGPGHCYAIDSTIGDIYLRSSVNRAWIIGRPIVYIVVDIWSAAVVGFYVCLRGPSWATASMAVFSAACDPQLLGSLWGYVPMATLWPYPTLPYKFRADRGEYVSDPAEQTAAALGFGWEINASYRPDYKGSVEVLNRITKDQQFTWVPGAINARRRELELRTDVKESVMTLQEYAQHLYYVFDDYNLCPSRGDRVDAEMMAKGVVPSPAGLWHFGHQIGIGYQKELSQHRLITTLLPEHHAVVRQNGLYLGQLQYHSSIIDEQQWTAHARNFGVMYKPVHHFPGSNSRIWLPDDQSGNLHEMLLHPQARISPTSTFDEWLDVYAYEKSKVQDREHARLQKSLQNLAKRDALINEAARKTREAEAIYDGPSLPTRTARAFEQHALASVGAEAAPPVERADEYDRVFEDAIQKALQAAMEGGEP